MNEKIIIEKNIRRFFQTNVNRKIAVLPFRDLSGLVNDVLKEEFNVEIEFIVDNNAYDMKYIYPMDRMPEGYEECSFFLAATGDTKKVLRKNLLKYVSEDKIIDLLFDEEREKILDGDSKVHIDFLSPGFAKCGTTSLHYALAQNPKIFLPHIKETYFLHYAINKTTHEAFKRNYKTEETIGKIVGDIDPAYRSNAEEVYRYFGSELKIIFCVRNPINMLYSYYKHEMRNHEFMEGGGYEEVCPEVFDQWALKYRFRGIYSYYIKNFLEYYPMEQIKIIVSEELYADPYRHMDDLQNFLGIPREDRMEYLEFPRENIGSKISKNQEGLEINRGIEQLRYRLRRQGDAESLAYLEQLREKVEKFTVVDYNEPMLDSTRQNLLEYYMDSIHELEGMLGRSLQGVWYS
ncbi:MAG: sulfotransferase domain-containing protein [Lachnospiraceae bacterium]|nr:sulfotransferase domain-containing protein [Lachnospiraceae bacterium]